MRILYRYVNLEVDKASSGEGSSWESCERPKTLIGYTSERYNYLIMFFPPLIGRTLQAQKKKGTTRPQNNGMKHLFLFNSQQRREKRG